MRSAIKLDLSLVLLRYKRLREIEDFRESKANRVLKVILAFLALRGLKEHNVYRG
jgi:hypothetical protein